MSKQSKVILSLVAIAIVFVGVSIFLDLDFVRWLGCNSPFAGSQEKNTDVCQRLDRAP